MRRSSPPLHPRSDSALPPSLAKDELRVGWLDSESGSYGGWVHLKCWRVPNRVWLGLPDPARISDIAAFTRALLSMGGVLLSGLAALKPDEMRQLARFCSNSASCFSSSARFACSCFAWTTEQKGGNVSFRGSARRL